MPQPKSCAKCFARKRSIWNSLPCEAQDLECRKAASFLAAGHVVCAIAKVANAYKQDTRVLRTFDPTGGIEFNKDTLAWKVEEQTVSVNTVRGRLKLRFLCSPRDKELLRGKRGQADLLLRNGHFYLCVAVTVAEEPPFLPEGVIGIDLGMVNIATDSEGNQYSGEQVKKVRKRCRRLRKLLQPRKTRSARKHLQKAGKRESRFVKDVNHVISKKMVQLALDRQKALACEDLTGIRGRGNSFNRAMRTEILCAEAQDLECREAASFCEGNRYTGEAVQCVRKRCRRLRQELQARKTRSARKRMAKRRRKESRFVRDVNHCISKTLVGMALNRKKALAVEMLQGIRERANRLNRAMRTELNNWSFAQLKSFLAYKCRRAGVPLIEVDARYSSQQCSRCAHTERANRPSQEVFCCRYCGFQANADMNAALVLEARVTLSTGPRFYLAALAARGGQAVRL